MSPMHREAFLTSFQPHITYSIVSFIQSFPRAGFSSPALIELNIEKTATVGIEKCPEFPSFL